MNADRLQRLLEKEQKIKQKIRDIQRRESAEQRKTRNARLIRFGIVVEALLKSKDEHFNIEEKDWIPACRLFLSQRDFEICFPKMAPPASDGAHLNVSPAEKRCAPAAGDNIAVDVVDAQHE